MGNRASENLLRDLCEEMVKRSLLDDKHTLSTNNVFSVFEVIDKEVPYCRVLLHLIREYWPSFEKDVLGGCCNGEKLQQSEREYFCGAPCAAYDKEGRMDILLETAQHVVAIEVKVGAGEQENQLIRYYQTLNADFPSKSKHVYFLTMDGHDPQTTQCDKDCAVKCKTEAISICFNQHIAKWLEGIVDGGHFDLLASHFLEVLNMSKMNFEQTQQYLDVLKQAKEYPKIVSMLGRALPTLWEEIRTAFLQELTAELCDKHGFQRTTEAPLTDGKEIWAEKLQKNGHELCLCYQTNFFIRTGKHNKQWTYISKAAFGGLADDSRVYYSDKESEAFCLTRFHDSNDALVNWFYERDRYSQAIPCIAKIINDFFDEQQSDA